jgi:hypothetical protein
MNKTYNVIKDGKIIATYPQPTNAPTRKTLKETIARAKFARRNARLVNIITK